MPVINGTDGNDVLIGTGGDDAINGLAGDDLISGGAGADVIDPGSGVDTVYGEDGDDTLRISVIRTGSSSGQPTIFDGGTGVDTADLSGIAHSGEAVWNHTSGNAPITVYNYILSNVEVLQGSNGADLFTLSEYRSALSIYGGGGNDRIFAGPGVTTIDGGAGADSITLYGGAPVVSGGDGDDIVYMDKRVFLGGAIASGGSGLDQLHFYYSGATIDLAAGTATSALSGAVTISGFEYVWLPDIGDSVQTFYGDDGDNFVFSQTPSGFTAGTTTFYLDGRGGNDSLRGGAYGDTLLGGAGADELLGVGGDDFLYGGEGNDSLSGGLGSDLLDGGSGSDTIDGGSGSGVDTYVLASAASQYYFVADPASTSGRYLVYDGLTDVDRVSGIERVRFGASDVSFATAVANSFDGYRYIAGYADLLQRYGGVAGSGASGYRDFISTGQALGRTDQNFDTLTYIASNIDLVRWLGTDVRRAAQHYVENGYYEGRQIATFNALIYAASYVDLAKWLGTDTVGATRHYIEHGVAEGRSPWGFDALLYLASNPDLAYQFGTDGMAAVLNYLQSGADEGRPTTGFDGRLYAASSVDLAQYIGLDPSHALSHYLEYGVREGRPTSGFDSVAYLLSYSDLAGNTASQALDQWLVSGADAGRVGDAYYGREQGSHALTSGSASAALEAAGDRDWFSLTLTAGQAVTIDVLGAGSGVGSLSDAVVSLYDSLGHHISTDDDSGAGLDARLTFTATTAGDYYVVVTANGGVSGTYQVAVTGPSSAPPSVGAPLADLADTDNSLTGPLEGAGWGGDARPHFQGGPNDGGFMTLGLDGHIMGYPVLAPDTGWTHLV